MAHFLKKRKEKKEKKNRKETGLNFHCITVHQKNLILVSIHYYIQCDQKKIAKCLQKLPKNDFTRKMIDFNTFTKIA